MTTALLTGLGEAVARRRYRWFHRRLASIDFRPGIVSFTFDDFPASAARVGAKLLEGHGWRGTFYLAPGLLGTESDVGPICAAQDVETLHRASHEIGNHGFSHRRCQGIGGSALRAELAAAADWLRRVDGNRSFALPFGSYDATALNVLSGRFDTIRAVTPGVNLGMSDLNLLRANAVYESSDTAVLRAHIESTRREGGWLIFYTHDLDGKPSPFGCTIERFQALLEWVQEARLTVLPVRAAFELLGDQRASRR